MITFFYIFYELFFCDGLQRKILNIHHPVDVITVILYCRRTDHISSLVNFFPFQDSEICKMYMILFRSIVEEE